MTPREIQFSKWATNSLLLAYRVLVRENSPQMWAVRDAVIQEIRLEAFDRVLAVF